MDRRELPLPEEGMGQRSPPPARRQPAAESHLLPPSRSPSRPAVVLQSVG